jgi:tRNA1(Val) A37 N6-methylase TrmN6
MEKIMLVVHEKRLPKVLKLLREQTKKSYVRVFVKSTNQKKWKKLIIKVYKNREEFEEYRRR